MAILFLGFVTKFVACLYMLLGWSVFCAYYGDGETARTGMLFGGLITLVGVVGWHLANVYLT